MAFEDVCLVRDCTSQHERNSLARLCDAWNCHLRSPTEWAEGIRKAGAHTPVIEDAHALAIKYLERISLMAKSPNHEVPAQEMLGWDLGLELARLGLISYMRIVGYCGEPVEKVAT